MWYWLGQGKTFWREKSTSVYMNVKVCRWGICWETAPKKTGCLSWNVLEVQFVIFEDYRYTKRPCILSIFDLTALSIVLTSKWMGKLHFCIYSIQRIGWKTLKIWEEVLWFVLQGTSLILVECLRCSSPHQRK